MGNISFVEQDVDFDLLQKRKLKQWLKDAILEERKRVGELTIVFCSDNYLLSVNKDFLKHDYYTDIITFDYCEADVISGDLLISIDRVKENATVQKVSFIDELNRVMIHGVLHLFGYKDKTQAEAAEMRQKEDYYLLKRL